MVTLATSCSTAAASRTGVGAIAKPGLVAFPVAVDEAVAPSDIAEDAEARESPPLEGFESALPDGSVGTLASACWGGVAFDLSGVSTRGGVDETKGFAVASPLAAERDAVVFVAALPVSTLADT